MENLFLNNLLEGLRQFFEAANWVFIVCFMLLTWLFNSYTDSDKKAGWLTFLSKIPKAVRTLILGIVLAWIFAWLFDLKTKEQFSSLFFSIIIAMVIWKIGIDKMFKWLAQKWLKT